MGTAEILGTSLARIVIGALYAFGAYAGARLGVALFGPLW